MKKLPVGFDDFKKIRENQFYYVDKTKLIEHLLANWSEVNFFTRPRRFGKTLNMSMLKSFFEIGTDKALFEGLYISKNQELCEEYMGKYPVVFLSLKGVEGLTFEEARAYLCELIINETRRFKFLLNSERLDNDEKNMYHELLSLQEENRTYRHRLKDRCFHARRDPGFFVPVWGKEDAHGKQNQRHHSGNRWGYHWA